MTDKAKRLNSIGYVLGAVAALPVSIFLGVVVFGNFIGGATEGFLAIPGALFGIVLLTWIGALAGKIIVSWSVKAYERIREN
jgi:hypothetical protein